MKRLISVLFALAILLAGAAVTLQAQSAAWWRNAVVYEIYPRSFADTNGDGIGDLKGILQHLDYLKDLGVDAIWITPFYPSPQVDFGYDIADYKAIDPQYGTMADFDRLVAEARARGIKVITDLVLNHTSDKHAWFTESRASRTNPKANWYVWRDGKPGNRPPNNWQSLFGHSAWQFEPRRAQYYYHEFYKEQPDLNWNNRDVRNAMYDTMRWWMKRGVAGFRLDAITSLFEDPQWRDEPVARPGLNAYGEPILARQYTDNLPQLHDVLRELRQVTDEFPGAVLIGETYVPNVEELAKMYGPRSDELHLAMDTQFAFVNRLSAADFRARLRDAEMRLNGNAPLLLLDNHDNARSWNRYGDGRNDMAIAKLMATLLLAPRGSALLYYGQELGMENNDPKRVEDVRDPIGKIGWPREKGRDGERTPMQWDAGKNAGFSTAAAPWLPVAPGFQTRNVAVESKDPASLLNYYKALIRLRKQNPVFREGEFALVEGTDPDVVCWLRKTKDGRAAIAVMNFSAQPKRLNTAVAKQATTLVSSFAASATVDLKNLSLAPYGAYVGEVK